MNAWQTEIGEVYVKTQCMHCSEPACVAACLTEAMHKTPEGAVIWRGDKCMGCRYCMVSCPFDAPKFEYFSYNPKIEKCSMCHELTQEGKLPACVENCPAEAMMYGTRRELIKEARKRIVENPGQYFDQIYGEHEAGGTAWLYISGVPFEKTGFNTGIQKKSYPELSKGFLYSVPAIFVLWPAILLGIREGTKVFSDQISDEHHKGHKGIIIGLSKICAVAMFAYFFLQIVVFVHGKRWELLNTSFGYWYLTEMIGFVILPMMLFYYSYTRNSVTVAKVAAVVTMVGIIINRLNVTVIGFRWDEAIRYVPSWMEFVVTLTVIFAEIWIFRWVITRLPVLRESPSWAKEQH